ncbi:hypothetical protein CYMTET_54304 [Cymbomonas tetramitiformis]|uniref:Uncharacterized protein n=1 Tax=Cymbomonas tetramitiformis TaxID=36881 RepID=A0AAE0BFH4_9CHLO|nr:hypothetical protein CYMTET_54304 [Cymbomonas tetramitiformis]
MLHKIPRLGVERLEDDLATPWQSPARESLAGTGAAGRRELRDAIFENNATLISNETLPPAESGPDYALMTNAGVVILVLMFVCLLLIWHRRRTVQVASLSSLPRRSNVYNTDLPNHNTSYVLPAVEKDSGLLLEPPRYALVIMPSSRDGVNIQGVGIASTSSSVQPHMQRSSSYNGRGPRQGS